MGRVTKKIAAEITERLTNKIQKEIDATEKLIEEHVLESYLKSIPKEVMVAWKKCPKYCKSSTTVYPRGEGIANQYRTVKLYKSYPCTDGWSTGVADLTPAQAKKYVELLNRLESLKAKKEDTGREIENTIIGMSTYKRLAEEMPELKPYIPVEESRQLIRIPKSTKDKIKCLIDIKDTKCIETI